MGIEKPYFRIWRPMLDGRKPNYVGDIVNSHERYHLSESYNIIEKDLLKIFEFVQPNQDNFKTFSHRIFELFFRASSEFEANCKQILLINNYTKGNNSIEESRNEYSIKDYYKINSVCKLYDYVIGIDFGTELFELKPFEDWEPTKSFKLSKNNELLQHKALTWYDEYNQVKHDRVKVFNLANLENLLKSVAALQTIMFAQYFTSAILKNRKL